MVDINFIKSVIDESVDKCGGKPHIASLPHDLRTNDKDKLSERKKEINNRLSENKKILTRLEKDIKNDTKKRDDLDKILKQEKNEHETLTNDSKKYISDSENKFKDWKTRASPGWSLEGAKMSTSGLIHKILKNWNMSSYKDKLKEVNDASEGIINYAKGNIIVSNPQDHSKSDVDYVKKAQKDMIKFGEDFKKDLTKNINSLENLSDSISINEDSLKEVKQDIKFMEGYKNKLDKENKDYSIELDKLNDKGV